MNVAILLFDEVEVLDFAGPFEVFSVTAELTAGDRLRVFTVAESSRPVRAVGGLRVVPDYALTDGPTPDLLVVPGGNGTRRQMDNSVVLDWVKKVRRDTEIVMSVCSGARILARAGLLDGLTVTTHHQVVDHLRQLAPRANVDASRRFIDAGSVVTTGGISAGIDGSLYLVARLFGHEAAQRTAEYMEYDWTGRTVAGATDTGAVSVDVDT